MSLLAGLVLLGAALPQTDGVAELNARVARATPIEGRALLDRFGGVRVEDSIVTELGPAIEQSALAGSLAAAGVAVDPESPVTLDVRVSVGGGKWTSRTTQDGREIDSAEADVDICRVRLRLMVDGAVRRVGSVSQMPLIAAVGHGTKMVVGEPNERDLRAAFSVAFDELRRDERIRPSQPLPAETWSALFPGDDLDGTWVLTGSWPRKGFWSALGLHHLGSIRTGISPLNRVPLLSIGTQLMLSDSWDPRDRWEAYLAGIGLPIAARARSSDFPRPALEHVFTADSTPVHGNQVVFAITARSSLLEPLCFAELNGEMFRFEARTQWACSTLMAAEGQMLERMDELATANLTTIGEEIARFTADRLELGVEDPLLRPKGPRLTRPITLDTYLAEGEIDGVSGKDLGRLYARRNRPNVYPAAHEPLLFSDASGRAWLIGIDDGTRRVVRRVLPLAEARAEERAHPGRFTSRAGVDLLAQRSSAFDLLRTSYPGWTEKLLRSDEPLTPLSELVSRR